MQEDLKYNNPIPVAVAIVPIKREKTYKINNQEVILEVVDVLYVRRNIEPKKGMLALPGGFVNEGERLETGGKRELEEEIGLIIDEEEFKLFRSEITPNNRNLIFGITPTRSEDVLNILNENLKINPTIKEETQEFVIGNLNIKDAAFPLHQKAIGKFLDMVNGMMLNFAIRDYSKDTVNDIVEALKIDGYLTRHSENVLLIDKTLCFY